jgi:SAM-dependent methyltransferase
VSAFVYRVLWILADVFQKAANACLHLSAGFLRQNELRASSQLLWGQFGSTTTSDVDSGLEASERQLYRDLLRASDRVLLIGCGSGRDLLALRELGYDVTGLEPVPELVDLARGHLVRRGMTARVLTGFAETAELNDSYDVVVFSPTCYSNVQCSESRAAMLSRITQHLAREGRIAITYVAFPPPSRASNWLIGLSATLARADWRPELGDSFSRGYLVPRVLRYEHLFRPGEVAGECAAAGLCVIRDEPASSPPYVVAEMKRV